MVGSGKTTLIEQLIPRFVKRGLKVSMIKHAHHSFDVDQPGKDSYRHRQTGCSEVMVVSDRRWSSCTSSAANQSLLWKTRSSAFAVRSGAG